MRWLRSPTALMAHLVFLIAIALLTYSILVGDHGPGGDYPLALAFCAAAYPLVLILVWLQWRFNGGRVTHPFGVARAEHGDEGRGE